MSGEERNHIIHTRSSVDQEVQAIVGRGVVCECANSNASL